MTDQYAVAGAPLTPYISLNEVGSIAIFERTNNTWDFKQQILPEKISKGNLKFGQSVAIEKNAIVVGASGLHPPSTSKPNIYGGRAFVYGREMDGTWQLKQEFQGNQMGNDRFGEQVAISGKWLAISAPFEKAMFPTDSCQECGNVYLYYNLGAHNWALQTIIANPNPKHYSRFGYTMKMENGNLLISTLDSWVHLFSLSDNNSWKLNESFYIDDATYSMLGLALSDSNFLVGFPTDKVEITQNSFSSSGNVHVYKKVNNSQWVFDTKIPNPDPTGPVNFGIAIDIFKDKIVVGTPLKHLDNVGLYVGTCYYYEKESSTWQLKQTITAPDKSEGDYFGWDVKINPNGILTSSPLDGNGLEASDTVIQAGSLHFFTCKKETCCEEDHCAYPYPNPSNGVFFVDNLDESSVDVVDLTGRSQKFYLDQGVLDISHLANSMYFIRSEFCSWKLIKTH
jgi:hypothetical protein